MSKFWLTLLKLGFYFIMLLLLAASYIIYYNIKDLPNYKQLAEYNPPLVTRFYSKDAKLLEEYAKESRIFIPIKAIPKKVIGAFLSAEDKNFYSHPGIDISSLGRAIFQNIVNLSQNKKNLVGGSTITQQVVKNFLVGNEKSINRKIKEAILSFRVTNALTKDHILELYLNQIYFGQNAYGIAKASLNYFNKSVKDLSVEEMAFLASLPKAPSIFNNSSKNYQKTITRRNWVIDRMEEENFITQEEAKTAKLKPITLNKKEAEHLVNAGFFAEVVRKKLIDIYGVDGFYQNGMNVITTLDPKLQLLAEKTFRRGLEKYDQRKNYRGPYSQIKDLKNWQQNIRDLQNSGNLPDERQLAVILKIHKDYLQIGLSNDEGFIKRPELKWALRKGAKLDNNFKVGEVIVTEHISKNSYKLNQLPRVNGGLVVMEVASGRVLALVGGYNYKNTKFDRATQAIRQPGSVFKTFVYLTAFENNFNPTSIVNDSPVELYQGPGMPMWRPKNYYGDYLGPITLRRGFELSRNTVTVNIARLVGIDKIKKNAQKFGISSNANAGYAMVLGSMETTLLDMTNAYNIVASNGKRINPVFIEKIQDRNGHVIYRNEPNLCQNCITSPSNYKIPQTEEDLPTITKSYENIIDPKTAYQMVSLLEGVVQHTKNGQMLRDLGKTLAGKTGTTNNSLDTWFIGFSPELVVGTFVGHDHPESLGNRETGTTIAMPIFADFMKEALEDRPDLPFAVPPGIKFVKVDYYSGKPSIDSDQTIYEAMVSKEEENSISKEEMARAIEEEDDIDKLLTNQ